MEVCAESVESVLNAQAAGAARVELCSALMEGGLTPSLGLLKIVKARSTIPIFTMIRPRGGDFCYSEAEFAIMQEDLKALKDAGADGIVFGILNPDGSVDVDRCRTLVELARPLPVTFHRAFDMVSDAFAALEAVVSLGIERILTSGLESTSLEGAPLIAELVRRSAGRVTVVPGGGITERNIERILAQTGACEYHCTARSGSESHMRFRNTGVHMGGALYPSEYTIQHTSAARVSAILHRAGGCK